MKNKLTLGSLFDGSGGFPLAGILSGIEPIWSSDIEPFPIRVTEKRLPNVKHYGDIKLLNGVDIEPVDIITFGSPCVDMSTAGRRCGIHADRSGLFFDAIRIIKEMRCATNGKYPRYAVWENVCGAFSSNKCEDFLCVLEAFCKVKDDTVSVPGSKKWRSAGEIVGDGFSIAWRTLNAQFWGVPQRRRRIFLVADLGGTSAGKILFDSESLSGHSKKSRNSQARIAAIAEIGIGTASADRVNRSPITENIACYDIRLTSPNTRISRHSVYLTETSRTLDTNSNSPDSNQGGVAIVAAINGGSEHIVRRLTLGECAKLQGFPDWWCSDLGTDDPTADEVIRWQKIFDEYNAALGRKSKPKTEKQIRRWLKEPHMDSAEFKMWGNGVALPCVVFVLAGIAYFNSLEPFKEM